MPDMMLAVVKPKAAPGAEIREVKVPGFGRTDVLVKVKVASICGTDLHIYEWDRWAQNRIHPPLIPGHEFCGEVVAYGDEVTSVKKAISFPRRCTLPAVNVCNAEQVKRISAKTSKSSA